jgi:hypothetical protein
MKFQLNNNSSYSEVGQVNALRWKILFRNGDVFTDQSGWIKCKDFFNDVLAWFKEEIQFSVYGFNNKVKHNEEGVYMLLKFIHNVDGFLKNLEVVNTRLHQDLGIVVAAHKTENNDEVVILLPMELWKNTFRISLVSMMIRLCNYGVNYTTWEDFWKTGTPARGVDHAFNDKAIKYVEKHGFNIPDKFKEYWWYAGKEHNNKVLPNIKTNPYLLHNNGVCGWVQGMDA